MVRLLAHPVRTLRRLVLALALTGFGLGLAVLSLSDRAPSAAFWRTKALSHAIESRAGYDLFSFSYLPFETDSIGHFVIWGTAGVLAWFALGRRVTAVLLIVGLVAVSAGVEVAQPLLSHSRNASLDDLAANALGVSLGVSGAWLVSLLHPGARRLA